MAENTVQSPTKHNVTHRKLLRYAAQYLISFVPSLLAATYPALLLYQTNIGKLTLSSLERVILFYALIALIVYIFALLFSKFYPVRAGNRAFIFLIFFSTYGWVYNLLLKYDWFRIEHYTLLPVYFLVALYSAFLVAKIDAKKFRSASLIFVTLAVGLSLANIIPAEVHKAKSPSAQNVVAASADAGSESDSAPDIYFIILDEFSGFNTMRSYWQYEGVDQFVGYLEKDGFYVAQSSRSSSASTFHELAERLNYMTYPVYENNDVINYFNDIYNSKVTQYLKEKGYTTLAFDETHHFYPSFEHINADYVFDYDAGSMASPGTLFDDFGILVADKTMLVPFANFYRIADPKWAEHAKWISFTADKVGNLNEITGPKFVYVHLLLPHNPFMFDKSGNPVDPQFYFNWNYYLGNYQYAMTIAKRTISNILSQYDSTDQPIIILQSDHGARNLNAQTKGAVTLSNYPDEDQYDIMNALYLPGYDYSQLTQDIKPINTFPIILDHYFGENIPLQ